VKSSGWLKRAGDFRQRHGKANVQIAVDVDRQDWPGNSPDSNPIEHTLSQSQTRFSKKSRNPARRSRSNEEVSQKCVGGTIGDSKFGANEAGVETKKADLKEQKRAVNQIDIATSIAKHGDMLCSQGWARQVGCLLMELKVELLANGVGMCSTLLGYQAPFPLSGWINIHGLHRPNMRDLTEKQLDH